MTGVLFCSPLRFHIRHRSRLRYVYILRTLLMEFSGALFMMDPLFWASKSQQPFTAIIKLGRARAVFNKTLIVFV